MFLPEKMGIITIVIANTPDGGSEAKSFVQSIPEAQVPMILREVANDLAREIVAQAGLAPHDESVPHTH